MPELVDAVTITLLLIGFLIAGGVGWVQLRSQTTRGHTEELEDLAKTRGHRIHDLESSNKRLETQVANLASKVENLQGQMEALQRIKANEIALEVVRLLDERENERTYR